MAEAAINDKLPVRIDASGGLFLDDGTTQHDINNLDGSSVELGPGWYEILRFKNKGLNQVPLEGDEQPSTLKFRCKCTAPGSSNLATIAVGRETSGANAGKVKTFGVYVKHPDAKGSATGVKYSFTQCYFVTPPRLRGGGADFDYWEFEMESTNPTYTRTTY